MGIFLFPNNALAALITPTNLIELTNQERAKYGLKELTENKLLTQAAAAKAEAIFAEQKFSHNFENKKFSQWIKDTGYQYSIVGENLAINFTADTPLFNAWLTSPMHKKNILHDDFREIGIAVKTGDWLGEETTLVVELFGAPAVFAEQSVPDAFFNNSVLPSYQSYYQNPAQLITSNLSEQYLNNIAAGNKENFSFSGAQIELKNSPLKNKTALINYLTLAVKMMAAYVLAMALIVLLYFYALYFGKLYKKLQLLTKI
jgi:hypothetical protein